MHIRFTCNHNILTVCIHSLIIFKLQAGPKLAEECAAQKKMVSDIFVSGSGDLKQNGVKMIVHVRAPDDEANCEKVQVCCQIDKFQLIDSYFRFSRLYRILSIFISSILIFKVIKAGLAAAGLKGAKSIAIPMVGAGMHGKDPMEMTRAIVRACGDFAQTQV